MRDLVSRNCHIAGGDRSTAELCYSHSYAIALQRAPSAEILGVIPVTLEVHEGVWIQIGRFGKNSHCTLERVWIIASTNIIKMHVLEKWTFWKRARSVSRRAAPCAKHTCTQAEIREYSRAVWAYNSRGNAFGLSRWNNSYFVVSVCGAAGRDTGFGQAPARIHTWTQRFRDLAG